MPAPAIIARYYDKDIEPMVITKEHLAAHGWVEKSGVMVRFGNPRIGWKPDGTLIVGWHEWPEKVTTIEQLNKVLCQQRFSH